MPNLQQPILGVAQRPPFGCEQPALAAEVSRRSPGANLDAIDPYRNIRGPIEVIEWRLRTYLHREAQRLYPNTGRQAVGKAILDIATRKPDQLGVDPLRLIERSRIVEQPDDPRFAGHAACRHNLAIDKCADRHGQLDRLLGRRGLEGQVENDSIEAARADFPQPAASRLRLGTDQLSRLQSIYMQRGGRGG